MPKYDVHLYPIVCVSVRDVEAESQLEAIKKVEMLVDLDKLFAGLGGPYVASIQYTEEIDGFLVDEQGDTEHKSTWYDQDYNVTSI